MTRHLYSGGLGGLSFPELLTLQVGICLPCLRVPSSTTLQELVECLSRQNRGPRATARDQRTLNGEAETMGSSIGDPPRLGSVRPDMEACRPHGMVEGSSQCSVKGPAGRAWMSYAH